VAASAEPLKDPACRAFATEIIDRWKKPTRWSKMLKLFSGQSYVVYYLTLKSARYRPIENAGNAHSRGLKSAVCDSNMSTQLSANAQGTIP
jgi:hypothetical protein